MLKGLTGSLILACAFAAVARADVLYQTGFEAPTFTAGQQLSGIDGWFIRIGSAANIVVQSATVASGSQAVQFTASGAAEGTRITRPFTYVAAQSTDKAVAISEDAQWSSAGTPSNWDLIVAFDGPGAVIGTFSVRTTGELYLSTSSTTQNTGLILPRGTWNHVELAIDYVNHTMTGFLNGVAISRPVSFPPSIDNSLQKVGFQLEKSVGADSMFFDNHLVVTRPVSTGPSLGPSPLITTLAGTVGPSTGPATGLGLRYPIFPIVDAAGNIYFSDTNDQRVWKVAPAGTMAVVAGTGIAGFGGDGGPASSAQLNLPQGLVLDGAGNLYIADYLNHRIRKVTPAGAISTVVGTGVGGFGGDGGPATSAQINLPVGMAIDGAGNLYFTDSGNYRVRKVTAAGVISTVAGNGNQTFGGDGGPATNASLGSWIVGGGNVTVDSAGNLYISDTISRVRMVNSSGIISTFAGNGTAGFSGDGLSAINAALNAPSGVAIDSGGNIFIADANNNRIRKVTPAGIISTVAGNGTGGYTGEGPALSVELNLPSGLVIDAAGNLYTGDASNNRVRKLTPGGTLSTVAGNGSVGFAGDAGPASAAVLGFPEAVTVDAAGNLYIADRYNHRVRKVNPLGVITTVAGNGKPGFAGDGAAATTAQLDHPSGVAVDSAGNLYIADQFNNRVRKVGTNGVITTFAGTGSSGFNGEGGQATAARLTVLGIAFDSLGNLLIADTFNNRVRRVTPAGIITTVAGTGTAGGAGDGGPATAAQLSAPYDVAADSGGNLYILDHDNNRIRKVTAAGNISTLAGTGTAGFSGDGGPASAAQLSGPQGITVDAGGSIYFTDSNNNRVRKIAATGVISTVAGTDAAAFGGDGGPASNSQLNGPEGIRADGAGNLFVADYFNNRIREIVVQPSVFTILSNPPGLVLTIDGASAAAPLTLNWLPGSQHTIAAAPPATAGARYTFVNWSDGGAASHTVTAGEYGGAYTATFTTQYLLTRNVAPGSGGTLVAAPAAADGYYDADTKVQLTATATAGFTFTSFSGDLTGKTNPQTVTMSGPRAVTANFTGPSGAGPTISSVNTLGGPLSLAQNAWTEIKGTNLAPASASAGLVWDAAPEFASGKMPTQLGGVSVTINGKPAYIYYVSPTQVNVLTPLDDATGPVPVVINNGALTSPAFTIAHNAAAPSFFLIGATKYALGTHADNSLLGPAAISVPGFLFTPAKPGETVILYTTGLGLPSTALTAGSSSQSGVLPSLPAIGIGGIPATVAFAGLISPGLYQLNVVVPANAPNGDNPLTGSYGGQNTPAGALITVQQ